MGFFGKRKDKKKKAAATAAAASAKAANKPTSTITSSQPSSPTTSASIDEPTMDMVPQLVQDLKNSKNTSGDTPARALRMLFSLSESANATTQRVEMVRRKNATLVPVLLEFLQRCGRGSSEQYLTLLVLNNISIPSENKRWIALECGGAQVFTQNLCEDPSCHLMAIILVNLTFCDAELRRELVSPSANMELVECLLYALRVASLTQEEYDARQHLLVENLDGPCAAGDLLRAHLEEDKRLRPALSNLDSNTRASSHAGATLLVDPARQLYPETARWCMSALRNLTRPTFHSDADTLVQLVDLVMRFITVGSFNHEQQRLVSLDMLENNTASHSSSSDSPFASDPEEFINAPSAWDSNSMQDAALFVVMNLSAVSACRRFIRDAGGVHVLASIATFGTHARVHSTNEKKQVEFQGLKARMALAYLVGSEGNFGQPRVRSQSYANDDDGSMLLLTDKEAELAIELVSNTLHQKAKDGPGGYSASTFITKWVLFAIRCLLTSDENQVKFIKTGGVRLNVLLLKVLAMHAINRMPSIDAEAAEYACFSLYLLSNQGFQDRFLPAIFGNQDNIAGTGSLSAKILTSYLHVETITPAGRHAADQLLLRLRYLVFKGSMTDIPTAFAFDDNLVQATESIVVEKRKHGARPMPDIFDRPICRSRAPKRAAQCSPWDDKASMTIFPNALKAVQELSFGSTKIRHMDAIDDILIANNIANCANGEKTESYDYWWSWQDAAKKTTQNRRQHTSLFASMSRGRFGNTDEPMSIFGMRCGSLCASDTAFSPN